MTSSRLGLANECLYLFRDDVHWPRDDGTRSKGLGNALHKMVELHADGKMADAEAVIAEMIAADVARDIRPELDATRDPVRVAMMFDRWLMHPVSRYAWEPEVPMAYDVDTGECRVLPGRNREAYRSRRPTERSGAADGVLVEPDRVVVADWKGGRQLNTEPAARNPQLRFNVAMAARAHQRDHGTGWLVYIDEDGIKVDEVEMDDLEISAELEQVRDLARRAKGTPEPRPGPWCNGDAGHGYGCPARLVCPVTREAMVHLGQLVPVLVTLKAKKDEVAPLAPVVELPLVLDIDNDIVAEQVRFGLKLIDAASESLWRILRRYTDGRRTFATTSGGWYQKVTFRGSELLPTPDALAVLARELGAENVDAVAPRTIVKEKIKAVLRRLLPDGRGVDARLEEIIAAVGAVGAVLDKPIVRYEERRAPPPAEVAPADVPPAALAAPETSAPPPGNPFPPPVAADAPAPPAAPKKRAPRKPKAGAAVASPPGPPVPGFHPLPGEPDPEGP